ncbi:MAG: hypothetical protein GF355_07445 [Candidatus Eisenbacteria bacterium]|nr:hypothetical protein [Candidatus Eisenbacteria bacterium]
MTRRPVEPCAASGGLHVPRPRARHLHRAAHLIGRYLGPAAALAAGLAGLHCDDAPTCGDDAGNRPPQVRITAGAVDSAAVDYRVTFAWEGSDPDGEIAGFE